MRLGLDTSGRYLNLALMNDRKLIEGVHKECFKHQSENILPELAELLKRNNCTPEDIDEIVVTLGPGSYTGIRIAMTLAKVWAKMGNRNLYAIDSLLLIAGKEKCCVYLDARGKRGYFGLFENGQKLEEDKIVTEEEFLDFYNHNKDYQYRCDYDLLDEADTQDDINEHFVDLWDECEKVENVDTLVPTYLKETSEYSR